jgi:hypothetical protein
LQLLRHLGRGGQDAVVFAAACFIHELAHLLGFKLGMQLTPIRMSLDHKGVKGVAGDYIEKRIFGGRLAITQKSDLAMVTPDRVIWKVTRDSIQKIFTRGVCPLDIEPYDRKKYGLVSRLATEAHCGTHS